MIRRLRTFSANLKKKKLQLGYCARIELYTRTVFYERVRFSLVSIRGHFRENKKKPYAFKGIEQYLPVQQAQMGPRSL